MLLLLEKKTQDNVHFVFFLHKPMILNPKLEPLPQKF